MLPSKEQVRIGILFDSLTNSIALLIFLYVPKDCGFKIKISAAFLSKIFSIDVISITDSSNAIGISEWYLNSSISNKLSLSIGCSIYLILYFI